LYILNTPLVDDAEIIVVTFPSLPRPRIIPPPARGRAVGRRCDGGGIAAAAAVEGEDDDDDVDHRDEDVPNDLEGGFSSFAQRRSRSGRERVVVGRAAPAAARRMQSRDDGGGRGAGGCGHRLDAHRQITTNMNVAPTCWLRPSVQNRVTGGDGVLVIMSRGERREVGISHIIYYSTLSSILPCLNVGMCIIPRE